ncbi:MAG TPA: family 1 encapsulin nanocompartment shell protein [Actinomycetota bacterium]|nr:family 1 encapsulin nanocompartment shell protein [Actinomycetota bacterium]
MNHLLRALAPLSDAAWKLIDDESAQQFRVVLAARQLVDFSGPHGWTHSAVNTGRTTPVGAAGNAVTAAARRVLPLVELRAEFELGLAELYAVDRGALDIDLSPLNDAVRRIALAETVAVFHGLPEANIEGIAEVSPHPSVPLGADFDSYPGLVARAVERLRSEGIGGPYGLALGPEGYTGVIETTEYGGYPVFDHLRRILGGPIVWAPGVSGGVVMSLRGGDFLFESGQDLSLGYLRHDDQAVHLYFEESFTFRVVTPEAAVALEG